ncbi:MAG: Ger(x)C family spore germination protein [Firmicutes bacterium]|nr:Ger(x)C family spore germination protein [Bacillota bacterium]
MRVQNKRVMTALIVLLISLSLITTGCTNRREMTDISIVTASGYDRVMVDGKPMTITTMYCIKPSSTEGGVSGGAANKGVTFSAMGQNIVDSAVNFNLRMPRGYFISDIQVMLLGEEFAKEGISDYIDLFTRQREIRPRTLVAVCQGKAYDVLQAQPELESLLSGEIANKIQGGAIRASKAINTDLFQVMRDSLTPGKEVVVPYIKVVPRLEQSLLAEGDNQTGSSGGKSGETGVQPKRVVTVSGSAVFLGDRMVGLLDDEETQGMLLIDNKARYGTITTKLEDRNSNISLLLTKIPDTEVKPMIHDDVIKFEIKIKGRGELASEENAVVGINKEDFKKAEELINKVVVNRCQRAVDKSQELKSDVFGFGAMLAVARPKYWEEIKDRWGEIFPSIKVNITADFKIENTGLMNNPIQIR